MPEEYIDANIDKNDDSAPEETGLEGGAYDVLRNRLLALNGELCKRADKLNTRRKEVFGGQELRLLGTERIKTEHNCVPRDIVSLGDHLIFGYNVFIGLKTETAISDVFNLYKFDGQEFTAGDKGLLDDARFLNDFRELYKYYKNARFLQFVETHTKLLLLFQVGGVIDDKKIFRFNRASQGTLTYIDDRGDMEYRLPSQHELEWIATTRENQVMGMYPHISIDDRVFVECVGGDLTIKIENNTETGQGIYSEPVEYPDQTLDDSYIHYAFLENLILLKIRPYKEAVTRYLVFNPKTNDVQRVDSIGEACICLPEGHGIIFPRGIYLEDGGIRMFDEDVAGMRYLNCIRSPNGEDFLYIFYHEEHGRHILIQYNLISKQISNPIFCHGYSLYDDGKMVIFNNPDDEPRRIHPMQIWQTPFYSETYEVVHDSDSFLSKIGNRDLVRGISEAYSISRLITRKTITLQVYEEMVQGCVRIVDGYHWLSHDDAFNLRKVIDDIKTAATSAVEEYEKVIRIRDNTERRIREAENDVKMCVLEKSPDSMRDIDDFVGALGDIRALQGRTISLRDLRYTNLERIEELEEILGEANESVAVACVGFLLRDDAFKSYVERTDEIGRKLKDVKKIADVKPLQTSLEEVASRLDLLTDVVNNLNIEDSTKTTRIIDSVTDVYAGVNRTRAMVRNISSDLGKNEAKAEFAAQFKLLSQSITNFIGMCDTTAKCDEYLTKLMITIEELESQFADFEEFAEQLAEKREEAYSAFTDRKQILAEEQKRKIGSLLSSAERILKSIINRAETFKDIDQVNAYFASDLMVSKLRGIVQKLHDAGDSVKADDFTGQLKRAKDEILRRLRDKIELFDEGENIIRLGNYKFTVNTQPLDLTIVYRNNTMFFHLTGTDFFEPVDDPEFIGTRPLWNQELVSETADVYRSEFLAYKMLSAGIDNEPGMALDHLNRLAADSNGLLDCVRQFSSGLYNEGYEKGVHDHDAALILAELISLQLNCGLLRYDSRSRSYAILFWCFFEDAETKKLLRDKLQSIGNMRDLFGAGQVHQSYVNDIRREMDVFYGELNRDVEPRVIAHAAEYLYHELQDCDDLRFTVNQLAHELHARFRRYLKQKKTEQKFLDSIDALKDSVKNRIDLIHEWVSTYVQRQEDQEQTHLVWEVVALIAAGNLIDHETTSVNTFAEVEGLLGQHPIIHDHKLSVYFDRFLMKLKQFTEERVPMFERYSHLRKELTDKRRRELRLSEFQPNVMGAFVRNKLINDVYLNLVGANFAKQMGAAGDNKRTDLMGLLLLISPPGYGKTTLMEYIANRLGLTFMKINGPAIGHKVTSLDPDEAPNATAREELKKFGLAFEMGNNIMIYIDDIQHVNPEFLQKFISLCDAQRKIEGVYNGRPKTYDFRGKKVAVVMAGNPYTESGEMFRIPDMLSNRADTYNLGDITSTASEAFEMSYIENAMTSNPVLNKISSHCHADVYRLMEMIERNSSEGIEFEHNYSVDEVAEIVNVLKKLYRVRDVVLTVNRQYIYSAAQQDEYRTEPPFKLQGSYRNMNRMTEKIFPVMTDDEVQQVIIDHYYNEAQTLTTGAESNILKFREMNNLLSEEESQRWRQIKSEFNRRQSLAGVDDSDDVGKVVAQLSAFNGNIAKVRDVLEKGLETNVGNLIGALTDRGRNDDEPSTDVKVLISALNSIADKRLFGAAGLIPEEVKESWRRQEGALEMIASVVKELQDDRASNEKLRQLLEKLMTGSLVVDIKE